MVTTNFSAITPQMLEGSGSDDSFAISFLADSISVPEDKRLTEADRAIATAKGWTLVE